MANIRPSEHAEIFSISTCKNSYTDTHLPKEEIFTGGLLALIDRFANPPLKGKGEAGYYVRGICNPEKRLDENLNQISLLIIDGDKTTGNKKSCVPIDEVHHIVKGMNLNHILYPSASSDPANGIHRWRLVLVCPCKNMDELKFTIEGFLAFINAGLPPDQQIVNVTENNVLSQPWYFPTCPTQKIKDQYKLLGYFDGVSILKARPLDHKPPELITGGKPHTHMAKSGALALSKDSSNIYPYIGTVYSRLQKIPPDIEYYEWLSMGMALHNAWNGHPEGLQLWDEWSSSKNSEKWHPGECEKRWKSFNTGGIKKPVTILWLYKLSNTHGWTKPNIKDAQEREYFYLQTERELNAFYKEFAVVKYGSKAMIANVVPHLINGSAISFLTVAPFSLIYKKRAIYYIKETRDPETDIVSYATKKYTISNLIHSDRIKVYRDVGFMPHPDIRINIGELPFGEVFNLFLGYRVIPKEGDCKLYKAHILDNICAGDRVRYKWLMKYLANMFQNPAQSGQLALNFQGEEGIGKGVFLDILRDIMGQAHSMEATHPEQVFGKFNGQVAKTIMVVLNEAMFAGDHRINSSFKGLVTGATLNMEEKGKDIITMPNYTHIFISTNEAVFTPDDPDGRRNVYFKVLSDKKEDFDYFEAIVEEMEKGGKEAFLYEMLNTNLDGFNGRERPVSTGESLALQTENKMYGLQPIDKWLFQCASEGYILNVDMNKFKESSGSVAFGSKIVYKPAFLDAFNNWGKSQSNHFAMMQSMNKFTRSLKRFGIKANCLNTSEMNNNHVLYTTSYKIPSLEIFRTTVIELFKLPNGYFNDHEL